MFIAGYMTQCIVCSEDLYTHTLINESVTCNPCRCGPILKELLAECQTNRSGLDIVDNRKWRSSSMWSDLSQ